MTATEAEAFEGDELFEASIRMRQWDELAKERNVPTVDLRVYHEKCWWREQATPVDWIHYFCDHHPGNKVLLRPEPF
ncbi:MAG: hypothetical protein H7Z75_22085 [Ferruginibacter sp.]|nr:hypothetical protein [Cytophagales bacterium]